MNSGMILLNGGERWVTTTGKSSRRSFQPEMSSQSTAAPPTVLRVSSNTFRSAVAYIRVGFVIVGVSSIGRLPAATRPPRVIVFENIGRDILIRLLTSATASTLLTSV